MVLVFKDFPGQMNVVVMLNLPMLSSQVLEKNIIHIELIGTPFFTFIMMI